ncbi:TPA: dTDP-4-dehydrorhamnose 3,5-epimerase family protein, partial [Aeromonas hydrophila]
KRSPTFGQWVGVHLSGENKRQLWIPEGFAHGFLTLSDSAEFLYKTTNYYSPTHERSILWSDKNINIKWGNMDLLSPVVSKKDIEGKILLASDLFE